MLEISQVELPRTAIGSDRSENVLIRSETDIVNFLIVRDKLCVDNAFLDIPNSTGSVDAGCADQGHVDRVPVEGGQWGGKFDLFVVDEVAFEFGRLVVFDLPDFEGFTGCGHDIGVGVGEIGDPHEFGGWVFVVEAEFFLEDAFILIELDDVNLIVNIFEEGAETESVFVGGFRGEA